MVSSFLDVMSNLQVVLVQAEGLGHDILNALGEIVEFPFDPLVDVHAAGSTVVILIMGRRLSDLRGGDMCAY